MWGGAGGVVCGHIRIGPKFLKPSECLITGGQVGEERKPLDDSRARKSLQSQHPPLGLHPQNQLHPSSSSLPAPLYRHRAYVCSFSSSCSRTTRSFCIKLAWAWAASFGKEGSWPAPLIWWKSKISEYIITRQVSTGKSASLKLQSNLVSQMGSSVGS